ncbi:MarR family transcriptional regulator [Nocardia sp. CDC159]|uniref:MarR family transcriptional regulator n=1 Tax=Nocardia pulmonis TaxID=2951408 RepID=A0A9X2E3Y7_9NOCA|nr:MULTISPECIES: MarR family transcriptional regulator [Nocardia]MCM6773774.1 MarR family transcriptional regulator [Nocardia pulmonis]MCM6786661.1 MarR family transcriptional regulator [Nocardia sp. CDC159]
MSLEQSADRLGRLLGPLRRAMVRSIRRTDAVPEVSESQFELLRVLPADGVLGPQAAAERMHVAPSTVSNLVKAMTKAGLVERIRDPDDFRAVGLSLTPTSRAVLDRYLQVSSAVLVQALRQLPKRDQQALERAIPALERLLVVLTENDQQESGAG